MIVGPTASSKSDLAMGVARLIGGVEIVALDSMQVYRGMDVGTATPTAAEQAEVPHHLINLVDPSEEFAVAELQDRARTVIGEIWDRGQRAGPSGRDRPVRAGRDRRSEDPRPLPGGSSRA